MHDKLIRKESDMSRAGKNDKQGGSTTEHLRAAASHVQEDIREVGGQVRDAAQQKYEDLREQASQYYDQGRGAAMEWEHGLEQYVQEQPIKSLLIAAGVGAMVGFLWRRS
jgi:ElaB/YqjD/DUF883 family membrane-anchored ribosome-binding protein